MIENPKGFLYKGYTSDIIKRLQDHNLGKSRYTRKRGLRKLVFLSSFSTQTKALQYELMLKHQNHRYLDWLIDSEVNEL